MRVRRDVLRRFLFLYGTLYGSFGLASPFLPAFLTARGVAPEALGLLLGAGTAVRLLSAPLAGRAADVYGAFRFELVLFAILAALACLLYLPVHSFWMLALVNLAQAAMLAPLVPLSDALALSWSRSTALPALSSGNILTHFSRSIRPWVQIRWCIRTSSIALRGTSEAQERRE